MRDQGTDGLDHGGGVGDVEMLSLLLHDSASTEADALLFLQPFTEWLRGGFHEGFEQAGCCVEDGGDHAVWRWGRFWKRR